jgi:hypothetical protein
MIKNYIHLIFRENKNKSIAMPKLGLITREFAFVDSGHLGLSINEINKIFGMVQDCRES